MFERVSPGRRPRPSFAFATSLRPIASNVTAFASDGARFVVWQASGGPMVMLDTHTGQRSEPAPGCEMSDRPAPALDDGAHSPT
jgi:hypothetical protein